MNWGTGSDFWISFFHMGGYGLYVWGSYAVTFALIVLEIVMLRLRRRAALDSVAGSRR
jgi:heme exporter protein D